jgi:hypothetical protein
MTLLVPITRGSSAQPGLGTSGDLGIVGVEQGAKYVLRAANGVTAVFNDPTDIDHVGFLSEAPSGFDSPEIRESADVLVEGDGGVHGNFYFGRRPITFTGVIDWWNLASIDAEFEGNSAAVAQVSNRRMDQLKRASHALREDCTIAWTTANGQQVQTQVRRQQPLRFTGGLPKSFFCGFVAADHRIYSQAVHSSSVAANPGTLTIRNEGNTPAPAVITLRGGYVNPVIRKTNTGELIALGLSMAGNDTLVIDTLSHTVTLNNNNAYGSVIFSSTDFWLLEPGDNLIDTSPTTGGGSYTISWRDAYE